MTNKAISNLHDSLAEIKDISTVYNFGAGPAMLPKEVMECAKEEFLDWHSTGLSIIEMSHRSKEFLSIAEQSDKDLRELMNIPDNYRILFLQGGASSQFGMVPLNLLSETSTADYIHTGIWSGKAIKEAQRLANINVAASSEQDDFLNIPAQEQWRLSDDPTYIYYTANETITGVEFPSIPDVGGIPLVSDMTSNFLSRPLDICRYAVIFAGAQKNIGPAGFVIVIVREDLMGNARAGIPTMYDYAVQSKEGSMFNTPAIFSWYMAGLVLQWVKQQGGVKVMEQNSITRSEKLYEAIDNNDFYSNPVATEFRSRMNVPFRLVNDDLNEKFLTEAKGSGLVALKGHRSVGGMRASIYNAMPEEGINVLIEFMQEFSRQYG